jgi:hypothetical protein
MKATITTILLLLGLSTFSQDHYPIKNFLKSNCYSFDMVSHYSWSNFTAVTNRKQDAIISLGLTGLRLSTDAYANKDDNNSLYWLSPDRRGFQTDTGIILLKKRKPDFEINLCYQNQPKNIQGEWLFRSTVYRHYGSDPNVASTYSELGHDCAVLAARLGRNTNAQDYPVYNSPYWWEPRQLPYKGQNLVNIIAAGNEWDNQYSNYDLTTGLFVNKPTYSGSQYAIAWSVVYDSVKRADPTMLVSTTGIANGDPQILSDAIKWCNANRAGKLPFDVAEHHFYPWGWPWQGSLPGELSITPEAKKVKAAIGDVKLIAGEWSWDENPKSDIGAPAHDGYTSQQTVGQCAIRQIIKFSQIGLFGGYYYRLNPDYLPGIDSSAATFATSGLLKQTDDSCHIVRRTVGDYFAQVSAFGDYAYADSKRDDSVQVHRLTKAGAELYSAWTIESISQYTDQRGVAHPLWHERKYDYPFPAGTIYRLNDDSSGVFKKERHAAGNVTLTSSPIFFVADPVNSPLPVHLITFTAQKINQSVVIKYAVQDALKIEVERSADSRTWTNLGEGIFNNVIDRNPEPGRNYYRLKMYDQDGSFTYSFILSLQFGQGKAGKVTLVNSIGQELRHGSSNDVSAWKTELHPGVYLFRYEDHTEKYLKN